MYTFTPTHPPTHTHLYMYRAMSNGASDYGNKFGEPGIYICIICIYVLHNLYICIRTHIHTHPHAHTHIYICMYQKAPPTTATSSANQVNPHTNLSIYIYYMYICIYVYVHTRRVRVRVRGLVLALKKNRTSLFTLYPNQAHTNLSIYVLNVGLSRAAVSALFVHNSLKHTRVSVVLIAVLAGFARTFGLNPRPQLAVRVKG